LLGNTKFEFYKIESVSENNYGSKDDENPHLLCSDKEYTSRVGKYSLY
jgi:hypothetical protein